MSVLTVIDTSGTQSYIFGSNRLRESIGASEIVARATTRWVFDVIKDFENEQGWQHNLKVQECFNPFDEIDETKTNNLQAEVIYCGGGNALILFDDLKNAKEFSRNYTRKLLEDAPNLQVVIAHSDKDFSLSETNLQINQERTAIMEKVNCKKANRKMSVPLLGLAVSAQCVSSGGVAIAQPIPKLIALGENLPSDAIEALQDKYKNNYLSAETIVKLAFAEKATIRLKREVFGNSITLEIPRELDHLGRTRDESSYVAFVHTDGNGMGERIKNFGSRFGNDREWIEGMRKFSHSIYEANQKALQETMKYLNDHLESDENKCFFVSADKERFELSPKKNKDGGVVSYYFPLRPIIFGGEDVAFVCDGRIALALTAFYLKTLREQELTDEIKYLYARAGVAIVKAHYPFRRAYDLSEQLAKSTKEKINAIAPSEKKVAAMDWHIAMSGLLGDLGEIREREYTIGANKLNMRPISLDEREPVDEDWRTWLDFEAIIREFQGNTPETDDKEKSNWREKRNKVKSLREALRNGKTATEKFRTNYTVGLLPKLTIKKKEDLRKGGWDESIKTCAYFDAVEMLDLFYRMKKKPITEAQNE
jgi:hypothetical protein